MSSIAHKGGPSQAVDKGQTQDSTGVGELQRWPNVQPRQVCHANIRSPLGESYTPDIRSRNLWAKALEDLDTQDNISETSEPAAAAHPFP